MKRISEQTYHNCNLRLVLITTLSRQVFCLLLYLFLSVFQRIVGIPQSPKIAFVSIITLRTFQNSGYSEVHNSGSARIKALSVSVLRAVRWRHPELVYAEVFSSVSDSQQRVNRDAGYSGCAMCPG